jgi:hypothetical protein
MSQCDTWIRWVLLFKSLCRIIELLDCIMTLLSKDQLLVALFEKDTTAPKLIGYLKEAVVKKFILTQEHQLAIVFTDNDSVLVKVAANTARYVHKQIDVAKNSLFNKRLDKSKMQDYAKCTFEQSEEVKKNKFLTLFDIPGLSPKKLVGPVSLVDEVTGNFLSKKEHESLQLDKSTKIYTYQPDGLGLVRAKAIAQATYKKRRMVDAFTGRELSDAERTSLVLGDDGKTHTYLPGGQAGQAGQANRLKAVSYSTYKSQRPVDAVTGVALSDAERTSLVLGDDGKTHTYLPGGQAGQVGQANRLKAVSYFTYRDQRPVDAVTGVVLSDAERTSLVLGDDGKTHTYLPGGRAGQANRLKAVSYSTYLSQRPVDAVTGVALSDAERASLVVGDDGKTHTYLQGGQADQANRLKAVSYSTYLNQRPVDAVTGVVLSDAERASLVFDTGTYTYLPNGKSDDTHRMLALPVYKFINTIRNKILSVDGYCVQKFPLDGFPEAALILFNDSQWKTASSYFAKTFIQWVNVKWKLALNPTETYEKPVFQVFLMDNAYFLILTNPGAAVDLDIGFPSEDFWLEDTTGNLQQEQINAGHLIDDMEAFIFIAETLGDGGEEEMAFDLWRELDASSVTPLCTPSPNGFFNAQAIEPVLSQEDALCDKVSCPDNEKESEFIDVDSLLTCSSMELGTSPVMSLHSSSPYTLFNTQALSQTDASLQARKRLLSSVDDNEGLPEPAGKRAKANK